METRYNEFQFTQRPERNFFKTSYKNDFTKKKINKRYGYGRVDAYIGADMISPKLSYKRDEINANYIKKNQAVLSKSKTGVTTYQYDYCGIRPNTILPSRY